MGKLVGESTVEIDAPIEEVYAVCADVLSAKDWQKGMLRMDALESDSDGRATLVEVAADGKVKEIISQQRFSYEPPTAVRWSQEKGDMKSLDGSWELEKLSDTRTRATYNLEADPGRMLGMLIRGPVEATLRSILVNARAGELNERMKQG